LGRGIVSLVGNVCRAGGRGYKLTWLTVAEKGTPLSLANAQVCRLAVATHAITLPVKGKMMSIVMAIVAALLPVVL
jgi:hypothetical protein